MAMLGSYHVEGPCFLFINEGDLVDAPGKINKRWADNGQNRLL